MTLVADMRSPHLWELWNSEYAFGTDASNEGFIVRAEHGWAVHRRGFPKRPPSVYPTLDEALDAAGVKRQVRDGRRARR